MLLIPALGRQSRRISEFEAREFWDNQSSIGPINRKGEGRRKRKKEKHFECILFPSQIYHMFRCKSCERLLDLAFSRSVLEMSLIHKLWVLLVTVTSFLFLPV